MLELVRNNETRPYRYPYYDDSSITEYARFVRRVISEDYLKHADMIAHYHQMTQAQFDVMTHHALWCMEQAMKPHWYTYWQRVRIAIRFIVG